MLFIYQHISFLNFRCTWFFLIFRLLRLLWYFRCYRRHKLKLCHGSCSVCSCHSKSQNCSVFCFFTSNVFIQLNTVCYFFFKCKLNISFIFHCGVGNRNFHCSLLRFLKHNRRSLITCYSVYTSSLLLPEIYACDF